MAILRTWDCWGVTRMHHHPYASCKCLFMEVVNRITCKKVLHKELVWLHLKPSLTPLSHLTLYTDSIIMCVLSGCNVTHTPTNKDQATACVYLPRSALWLWEQQVNTSPLYKQVGPVETLTPFSSSHLFPKGISVSTDMLGFNYGMGSSF